MLTEDKTAAQALLAGRYAPLEELGRGTQGRTLLVEDRGADTTPYPKIVLKELNLGYIDELKSLELFEREARVLQRLSHPQIPAYRDQFHLVDDDGRIRRYFLAQEYIEGENLRDLVQHGRLFTEGDIREFLAQLLDILDYLHAQDPPIIHRDIKPSNIMLRSDTKTRPLSGRQETRPLSGRQKTRHTYALVDFGAVQQQLLAHMGSSTVVGTSGYMPHEQLMGRAGPSSDLYALGATCIFLLSRRSPSEMTDSSLSIDFRPHMRISEEMARFLDRLVDRIPEKRFESAAAAKKALLTLDQAALEQISRDYISHGHISHDQTTPEQNESTLEEFTKTSFAEKTQRPLTPTSTPRSLAPLSLAPPPKRALQISYFDPTTDFGWQISERIVVIARSPEPPRMSTKLRVSQDRFDLRLPTNWGDVVLASIGLGASLGLALVIARMLQLLAPMTGQVLDSLLPFPGVLATLLSLFMLAIFVAVGAVGLVALFYLQRAVRALITAFNSPRLIVRDGVLYGRNYAQKERQKLLVRDITHVALATGQLRHLDRNSPLKMRRSTVDSPTRMLEVWAGSPQRSFMLPGDLPMEEQIYLLGELHAFLLKERNP